jgi:uncharacterized protein (TIGR02757 family)
MPEHESIIEARMIAKSQLDALYGRLNRRKYVRPDPLQFLYAYPDLRDREIVALIASSLAYGRVAYILKSVEYVIGRIGSSPRIFVENASTPRLRRTFAGFKHRFTTGEDVALLLRGIRRVVDKHGSLNECFASGMSRADNTVLPALGAFVNELGCAGNSLISSPRKNSACKRLHLFLRWMVRKDAVDPGGWRGVPRSKLIVPLDTHMAGIGRALKLTSRSSVDMDMALDITAAFRTISPRDPVKYDFALTRLGIRDDLSVDRWLAEARH